MTPTSSLGAQLLTLLLLAMPVCCIAWTVTHEDLFRELRQVCEKRSKTCEHFLQRKFFYLFTCEYCFSHYIAAGVLWLSGFQLLVPGWRGAVLGFFAVVWVANVYMSLFGRLRLDIKHEHKEIAVVERVLQEPVKVETPRIHRG